MRPSLQRNHDGFALVIFSEIDGEALAPVEAAAGDTTERRLAAELELTQKRLRDVRDITESEERYVIAHGAGDANVKVRDGKLQIKRLIERYRRLERWEPVADATFPLGHDFVQAKLAPAPNLRQMQAARPSRSLQTFLAELVSPEHGLWQASVSKRRFRFVIDDCLAEIDESLINGAAIGSIAVESAAADSVQALTEQIGLAAYENVSYPRAIRRVMGLEPARWNVADG